jgi:LacI family transcriptional regulator
MAGAMVTQKRVALLAGTSLKTVSRVINDDPLVNAETRARVRKAIAELGYKPHQAARMMRNQESNIIGFVANQVATTWASVELINGAQEAAWDLGKQLMLFNVDDDPTSGRERQAIDQLQSFRAEVVIYATRASWDVQMDSIGSAMPLVLLNCFDRNDAYPALVVDDYRAAFQITSEMIRRGARNPVFLNVHEGQVAGQQRRRGFIDAGLAAGLDVSDRIMRSVDIIDGVYTLNAYNVARDILAGPDRPDAILAGQDTQAMQVYFAVIDAGLQVGKDIAVASFDNEKPVCDLLRPGLSTMALPYFEMGYASVETAIRHAETPETGRRMFECLFVDRNSLSSSAW